MGRGGRGGKACRPAGQLGAVRLAVGSPDWLLARRVDLHSKRVRKRLWLDGASGAPVTVHGPHTDDETLMIQYGLAYDGWGVLQLGRRTLKAAHQLILWRHVASCGIGNDGTLTDSREPLYLEASSANCHQFKRRPNQSAPLDQHLSKAAVWFIKRAPLQARFAWQLAPLLQLR